MKLSPKTVDDTLELIARASGQSPSAKQLAHAAVRNYRQRQSPTLTQERIDNGSDTETRRQRFVASSLKFRRRGWLARLFR